MSPSPRWGFAPDSTRGIVPGPHQGQKACGPPTMEAPLQLIWKNAPVYFLYSATSATANITAHCRLISLYKIIKHSEITDENQLAIQLHHY